MDEEHSNEQQEGAQKHIRVGIVMGGLMTMTAVVFDALQAICDLLLPVPLAGVAFLIVGWFLSVVAFVTFLMWFGLLGVNYLNRNVAVKILILFGSVATELIPLINALPSITLGVVALIGVSRYEDLHGGAPLTLQSAMRLAVAARLPINHQWMRGRLTRDQGSRNQVVHKEMGDRFQRSKKTPGQFARDVFTGRENVSPSREDRQRYRDAQPFFASAQDGQGRKASTAGRVYDSPELRAQMRRQSGPTPRTAQAGGPAGGSENVRMGRTTINSGGGEIRSGPGAIARGVGSRINTTPTGAAPQNRTQSGPTQPESSPRATGARNEPGFQQHNIGGVTVTTGGRRAVVTKNGELVRPSRVG